MGRNEVIMLAQTITLPVVGGDVVVDRFSEETNKSVYHFDGATWKMRKEVTFLRSLPKASGAYPGNARGSAKITWDFELTDNAGATIIAPVIAEIKFSVPVGVSSDDVDDIIAHAAAVLNHATLPASVFQDLEI